jgi:hypothetical protein
VHWTVFTMFATFAGELIGSSRGQAAHVEYRHRPRRFEARLEVLRLGVPVVVAGSPLTDHLPSGLSPLYRKGATEGRQDHFLVNAARVRKGITGRRGSRLRPATAKLSRANEQGVVVVMYCANT